MSRAIGGDAPVDERGKPRAVEFEGLSEPAIPASLRKAVGVLGLLCALVVIALSTALHGVHGPALLDRSVAVAVRGAWPRVGLMGHVVDGLAGPLAAILIVSALVAGCLLVKRWRLAVVAGVGPLSTVATATVLKLLTGRTINGDNLAFPSGHTAFATAVAILIGLLVIGVARPGTVFAAALLTGLAVVAGVGMALDQVLLDAHFPSDTVGGFCTAVAAMSLTALSTDSLATAMQRHGPRARGAGQPRSNTPERDHVEQQHKQIGDTSRP